jgi:hypothetical protein
MGDIQTLKKPSNIPPVTLEELNDYSAGNKDQWINNHKIGTNLRFEIAFSDDNIYYLGKNMVNFTGFEEMIGYIGRGGTVFLPFYKRNNLKSAPTAEWEVYTTNFEMGGRIQYAFIFNLGVNEGDEREMRLAQERRQRESERVAEAIARSNRMMDEMNRQNEASAEAKSRLRTAEKQGESTGIEGVQLTEKNTGKQVDIGGRKTRRRRMSRRHKSTRRNKSSHKLRNKKSKKSKKYRRK